MIYSSQEKNISQESGPAVQPEGIETEEKNMEEKKVPNDEKIEEVTGGRCLSTQEFAGLDPEKKKGVSENRQKAGSEKHKNSE